jgi:predicted DNA-binding transcriptional regulator AlpA
MLDQIIRACAPRGPVRAVAWWSPDVAAWMQACLRSGGRDVAIPFEPAPRFLKLPEVRRITGLSRSSLYRKIADGKFPRPIRLGGGTA